MKINELKKYSNKKIAILGLGKEGKSSIDFLEKIGYKMITILDKTPPNLPLSGEKRKRYKVISGEKYLDNIEEYDLIFKTPGISLYDEKVYPHKEKIISNSEIFFNNYNGKVIGVTATKGKSTTVTLIYETLKNAGYKVKLVGNIGNPVLDEVDIINGENYDYIVYELSSYMLEVFEPKCFIAIFGNLYECHLAWHKNSFEIYKKAKFNILKNAENILIGDDFQDFIQETQIKTENIYTFGEQGNYHYKGNSFFIEKVKILEVENIILKGAHNKRNISSVLGVCDIITKSKHNSPWIQSKLISGLTQTLENFEGLSHRIENIGTYEGITFIDDAIATTQESTIAAIETFQGQVGTLFLGGQSGAIKYDKLRNILAKYNIPNIVLFPDSGNEIFEDFSKNLEFELETLLKGYNSYIPKLYKTNTMKNAVKFAYENTPKGKICLLSNAAPSFSLWKNFEEKGNIFQNEVKNYEK